MSAANLFDAEAAALCALVFASSVQRLAEAESNKALGIHPIASPFWTENPDITALREFIAAKKEKREGERCTYRFNLSGKLDPDGVAMCGMPRWASAGVQGHDAAYGHMFVSPDSAAGEQAARDRAYTRIIAHRKTESMEYTFDIRVADGHVFSRTSSRDYGDIHEMLRDGWIIRHQGRDRDQL